MAHHHNIIERLDKPIAHELVNLVLHLGHGATHNRTHRNYTQQRDKCFIVAC